MDENLMAVFRECGVGSVAGTMNFPTVVGKLIEVGSEGYRCDLYRREKTYYMPDGGSYIEQLHLDPREFNGAHIAHRFDEARIVEALRAVQTGDITYVEFLHRIMKAGCVGYQVCITGKRALYCGRQGDVYTEWFPGAK
jgi:uncharacterized protein YbcV (DUF1398 family)